ncbi:Uncharacterized protein Adt_41416 [Abeliophyllum distichum]|uniref:Uncharacterized protein n=1 Tax=Abeliophyllum distichum TaxID=126358 RepID=A0ABD1PNV6_9LAMI
MLHASSAMVVACDHKYWILTWEKAVEQATMSELIKMTVMNTAKGLVLNNELFNVLASFEGTLGKEKAKLNKLADDLKAMSSENTKFDSENALWYKVEALATVEANLKARLEFVAGDIRQAKGRTQAAHSQKRFVEASRKHVEERATVAKVLSPQ